MRQRVLSYLILGGICFFFVWQSLAFNFYQDDAYISYRYAANYLDGHGLVYNQGERIEGYTNFGWLLGLILSGVLGLDYILVSKILGLAFGATTILVTFLLAKRCLERHSAWWSFLAAGTVGSNLSLEYWAQSGLETAGFVFLTVLSLYLFVTRNWLLAPALVAAILVRPEGVLVAGLLVVIEWAVERHRPDFTVLCGLIAFVFTLPLIVFTLVYYGSLLPNPFYAKTAFDLEQLTAGVDYVWNFVRHYPLLAAGIVLPVFWRRLNREARAVWIFAIAYAVYVVLIGGDVLMVHRFLLPIMAPLAIAITLSVSLLTNRLKPAGQVIVLVMSALALIATGMILPRDYIYDYAAREKGLTQKMGFFAARLKEIGRGNFTVASSTIGRLGYDLTDHRMIDLLGLTDSTVARHPEPLPIGMESTWRERSFNSAYILQQAPDYIVFSTGLKPSAPAERALLRYDQFLNCYRGATWYYQPTDQPVEFPLVTVLRKMRDPQPPFQPIYPIDFVNQYVAGCNAMSEREFVGAARHFEAALGLGGDPPYVYLLYRMAINSFLLGRVDEGESLQNRVLMIDSAVAEVQADLYVYEYTVGHLDKAAVHRRWLDSLSPWLIPRYDSLAQLRARLWQSGKLH